MALSSEPQLRSTERDLLLSQVKCDPFIVVPGVVDCRILQMAQHVQAGTGRLTSAELHWLPRQPLPLRRTGIRLAAFTTSCRLARFFRHRASYQGGKGKGDDKVSVSAQKVTLRPTAAQVLMYIGKGHRTQPSHPVQQSISNIVHSAHLPKMVIRTAQSRTRRPEIARSSCDELLYKHTPWKAFLYSPDKR